MRRILLLPLFALALTAASASATGGYSGLYGTVTRGPTAPVCTAEQPCTQPAAGAVLSFFRNGSRTARVTVKDDGSYRVLLTSGLYTIRSQRRLEPATARVRLGQMIRVDFSIDTGIR